MNELGNTPADKNYTPSGISRAEERALERFPEQMTPLVYQDVIDAFGGKTEVDFNLLPRSYFQLGYEVAEKDLALTWEDIKTIEQIITTSDWYDFEINGKLWSQEFYEEVLTRFKQLKSEPLIKVTSKDE